MSKLSMAALLKSRLLRIVMVLGLVVGTTGVWVLLHPASFWLQPWRAAQITSSRFIFGPYPLEEDFQLLEKRGVTTVISLLNPTLPYESILLAQERALAERHGMTVLNFPMGSILGQSFGKDYDANSKAAAQAAIDSQGIVYIHCYLGLHRAKNVQKYLSAYALTSNYEGTIKPERAPDRRALDRAHIAFGEARYEDSLRELDSIQHKTSQVVLLQSWGQLHLLRTEQAHAGFAKVVAGHPDNIDGLLGLGFSALRLGDLELAERQFSLIMSIQPDNYSAIEGLGYVRRRQGNAAEAISLLERAVAGAPDNIDARHILEELREASNKTQN